MSAEQTILNVLKTVLTKLYQTEVSETQIQIQKTRKEFQGDYTLVTFPLVKLSKCSPEQTAEQIGATLLGSASDLIDSYNVVKGFLNIRLCDSFWINRLHLIQNHPHYGSFPTSGRTVMLEYSSPNTNKPLHLGHVRNNLLGGSVAQILSANGHKVIKVNLVNDRGIHICKSMIAWQKFGEACTPESTGQKGDHLVGQYYVQFDKAYKAEIAALMATGIEAKEAERQAPIMLEAQEMLRKWEAKDPDTIALWEKMNAWVYAGFDLTYKNLGVSFDHIYYESQTYLLGKSIVEKGLQSQVFTKNEDGSVWIDLTADGLDQKLLLRSDGTSVYMTQDLGTASQRYDEYHFDDMVYVVGNEQNYHFQVLQLVLSKLGNTWAKNLFHLSYGMVELPEGKMKSREGTVVDADDLIDGMVNTARTMSEELGKLNELSAAEASEIVHTIGLGALKYFILKVDPKKTMLFDPKESIDFNGNTGPFIQYTHARIQSVLRKAKDLGYTSELSTDHVQAYQADQKELDVIKHLDDFPACIAQAGANYSPALIANYVYELAKEYNQFYHDHQIIKEDDLIKRNLRLSISQQVAGVIRKGMLLLGITVPDRM